MISLMSAHPVIQAVPPPPTSDASETQKADTVAPLCRFCEEGNPCRFHRLPASEDKPQRIRSRRPRTPLNELKQIAEDINLAQPGFQITMLKRKIRNRPAWTNDPRVLYAVCMDHPQRRRFGQRWVRIVVWYFWENYSATEIAQKLGKGESPKSVRRVVERLNAARKDYFRMAFELREAGKFLPIVRGQDKKVFGTPRETSGEYEPLQRPVLLAFQASAFRKTRLPIQVSRLFRGFLSAASPFTGRRHFYLSAKCTSVNDNSVT